MPYISCDDAYCYEKSITGEDCHLDHWIPEEKDMSIDIINEGSVWTSGALPENRCVVDKVNKVGVHFHFEVKSSDKRIMDRASFLTLYAKIEEPEILPIEVNHVYCDRLVDSDNNCKTRRHVYITDIKETRWGNRIYYRNLRTDRLNSKYERDFRDWFEFTTSPRPPTLEIRFYSHELLAIRDLLPDSDPKSKLTSMINSIISGPYYIHFNYDDVFLPDIDTDT